MKKKIINLMEKIKDKKIYFSYEIRLILYLFTSIILLILIDLILANNFKFISDEVINYQENSNIDYKVYLKENDFYETDYLSKDMLYIAALIDKINIDFNYNFNSDRDLNIKFNYDIVGILEIMNEAGTGSYFTKEYTLVNNKEYILDNKKDSNILENVSIDYSYYNTLANQFKTSYGIDTQSYLKVYLRINKNSLNENFTLNNSESLYVTIPLSQKSINIKLDYKYININNHIINEKRVEINNYIQLLVAISLIIVMIIIIIKVIKLLSLLIPKKSKYDTYISKLLLQYDRLIVESNVDIKIDKYNLFPIKEFKELLDVRDNLKRPIMYKTITNHQKCYFYIIKDNELYLLIIKAVDLEKNNDKE